MAMKRILTTSQREQLLSVDHLSEEDFKAYFSFSDYDLEVINQHRGKVNKLGFAIQLCLARYPGCSLSNWPIKSTRLTSYVSRQLHLDAIDLNSYASLLQISFVKYITISLYNLKIKTIIFANK